MIFFWFYGFRTASFFFRNSGIDILLKKGSFYSYFQIQTWPEISPFITSCALKRSHGSSIGSTQCREIYQATFEGYATMKEFISFKLEYGAFIEGKPSFLERRVPSRVFHK
jgi:hypothetical protein